MENMNEILCSYSNNGERKVRLLSTKNTSGEWVLSVEPYIPLLITYSFTGTALGKETHAEIKVIDGADYSNGTDAVLGALSGYIRGNDLTIIPTSNTVILNVVGISNTLSIHAFQ